MGRAGADHPHRRGDGTLPSRIRGTVRLHPTAHRRSTRSRWIRLAGIAGGRSPPAARIEVELDRPALRWSGPAYLDTNSGDEPLERVHHLGLVARQPARRHGHPLRCPTPRAARDGAGAALRPHRRGRAVRAAAGGRACRRPLWRVARGTRAMPVIRRTVQRDPRGCARSTAARSCASICWASRCGDAREPVARPLRRALVQLMLPFRMPRRSR